MLIAIAKQCSRQELWRRRRHGKRARLFWCEFKQPQLIVAYMREDKYRRKALRQSERKRTMNRWTLRRQVAGWQRLGCVIVTVRRVPDRRRAGRRRSLSNLYTLTAAGAEHVRRVHVGTRIPLITTPTEDWEVPRPRRQA